MTIRPYLSGIGLLGARGKRGSRPKALNATKVAMARELYANKQNSIADICKNLNISQATLYRYIQPQGSGRAGKGADKHVQLAL